MLEFIVVGAELNRKICFVLSLWGHLYDLAEVYKNCKASATESL